METIIVIVVVLVAVGFLLLRLKKRVKNPFDCECMGNCEGCKFANDKQNKKDNNEKDETQNSSNSDSVNDNCRSG